jgi:protein SCO1/2
MAMIRVAALLVCLLACRSVPAADTGALKAGTFDPPRDAPDFSVNGTDGAPLFLSHYRGKVVVLAFGYTSCPNVCPITLAVLAEARRALGKLGSEVQVIYLTVDPERDNATRLKDYLAAFDPTFLGGTGTPAQMAAVRQATVSPPRRSAAARTTRWRIRRSCISSPATASCGL